MRRLRNNIEEKGGGLLVVFPLLGLHVRVPLILYSVLNNVFLCCQPVGLGFSILVLFIARVDLVALYKYTIV